MDRKPKVLALAGSTRRDSYNKKLLRVATDGAREAGADVTEIDLRDYPLPLYDEDAETAEGKPEPARRLKRLMVESDAFLIASPEYNGSITGVLKNLIDWVSRPDEGEPPMSLPAYRGKVVTLMSASPGGLGGLRGLVHVRAIFSGLGSIVLPDQIAVSRAYEAFDDEGNLRDEKQRERVRGLGSGLTSFVSQLDLK